MEDQPKPELTERELLTQILSELQLIRRELRSLSKEITDEISVRLLRVGE